MNEVRDEAADRARIEALYREIAPKLMNFLVANGADAALAADIVQESFLRLWKMRERLEDDPSRVSGLLFTIAKNLRKDRARKLSRETLEGEIRDPDDDTDANAPSAGGPRYEMPTVPSDQAYLRARLQKAFDTLPPLLKEAYLLFQVQELSIREIADRTQVSESLVKVRIFRAKEKLRPLLEDLL